MIVLMMMRRRMLRFNRKVWCLNVVVVVVEDFGSWVFGIFGEFSEYSENFRNFRRIFGEKRQKKSLVLRISSYSIWEVRYDILFDILKMKSPIYRHLIISRYDNLTLDHRCYSHP